jgi:hypothetical protein
LLKNKKKQQQKETDLLPAEMMMTSLAIYLGCRFIASPPPFSAHPTQLATPGRIFSSAPPPTSFGAPSTCPPTHLGRSSSFPSLAFICEENEKWLNEMREERRGKRHQGIDQSSILSTSITGRDGIIRPSKYFCQSITAAAVVVVVGADCLLDSRQSIPRPGI